MATPLTPELFNQSDSSKKLLLLLSKLAKLSPEELEEQRARDMHDINARRMEKVILKHDFQDEELIFEAVFKQDKEYVKTYLQKKGNVHVKLSFGLSLLGYAAKIGNLILCKMIINATEEGIYSFDKNEIERVILSATLSGQLDILQFFGSLKLDFKFPTKINGATVLMAAALHGHESCVEYLIPLSNLDATDNYSKTALIIAAEKGYHEIVHHLIKAGAKLNIADYRGLTALMFATLAGVEPFSITTHLKPEIEPAEPIQHTQKIHTQKITDTSELKVSSDESDDRDFRLSQDGVNTHVQIDYVKTISLLLAAGSDVFQKSAKNYTALLLSTIHPSVEITNLLLTKEPRKQIETTEQSGAIFGPLTLAILHRSESIYPLLEARADVNLQDQEGATPLSHASTALSGFLDNNENAKSILGLMTAQEHSKLVIKLLEANADPNQTDKEGRTPLMRASYSGLSDVVEILLKARASIDSTDQDGLTALFYAIQGNYPSIVQYLLSQNAQIEAISKQKGDYPPASPLMMALYYRLTNIVSLLLKNGANPLLIVDNKSTLSWAIVSALRDNNTETLEMFLKHLLEIYNDENELIIKQHVLQTIVTVLEIKKIEILKILIEAALQLPNFSNLKEEFFYTLYRYTKDKQSLELLLKHQAIYPLSPFFGECLFFILKDGNLFMLEFLINKLKMIVNFQIEDVSIFRFAIQFKQDTLVQFLINNNVDLNRTLPDGLTPLMAANKQKYNTAVILILSKILLKELNEYMRQRIQEIPQIKKLVTLVCEQLLKFPLEFDEMPNIKVFIKNIKNLGKQLPYKIKNPKTPQVISLFSLKTTIINIYDQQRKNLKGENPEFDLSQLGEKLWESITKEKQKKEEEEAKKTEEEKKRALEAEQAKESLIADQMKPLYAIASHINEQNALEKFSLVTLECQKDSSGNIEAFETLETFEEKVLNEENEQSLIATMIDKIKSIQKILDNPMLTSQLEHVKELSDKFQNKVGSIYQLNEQIIGTIEEFKMLHKVYLKRYLRFERALKDYIREQDLAGATALKLEFDNDELLASWLKQRDMLRQYLATFKKTLDQMNVEIHSEYSHFQKIEADIVSHRLKVLKLEQRVPEKAEKTKKQDGKEPPLNIEDTKKIAEEDEKRKAEDKAARRLKLDMIKEKQIVHWLNWQANLKKEADLKRQKETTLMDEKSKNEKIYRLKLKKKFIDILDNLRSNLTQINFEKSNSSDLLLFKNSCLGIWVRTMETLMQQGGIPSISWDSARMIRNFLTHAKKSSMPHLKTEDLQAATLLLLNYLSIYLDRGSRYSVSSCQSLLASPVYSTLLEAAKKHQRIKLSITELQLEINLDKTERIEQEKTQENFDSLLMEFAFEFVVGRLGGFSKQFRNDYPKEFDKFSKEYGEFLTLADQQEFSWYMHMGAKSRHAELDPLQLPVLKDLFGMSMMALTSPADPRSLTHYYQHQMNRQTKALAKDQAQAYGNTVTSKKVETKRPKAIIKP